MATHFESYFSQVVPVESPDSSEVDYSGSRLHTLTNGLQFELASFPEECQALDSYFRWYTPKQSEIAFDIGAYCGVFTHQLSKVAGQVIAFEPDPINLELLRRNIERHKLSNVTVAHVAVSDSEGFAEFNSEGALGSGISRAIDRPSAGTVCRVPTLSFEKACEQYGVPSFVKIDAEGSELEIIAGTRDFLRKNRINFVLDTNHLRNGMLTNSRIEGLFSEVGYGSLSSDDSGYMTTWARP